MSQVYVFLQLAGNESHQGHHTSGRLISEGDTADIEIRVPEKSFDIPVYIWNGFSDRFSLSVTSPTGETVSRVPAKAGTFLESSLILERSVIQVLYYFPIKGSGRQFSIVRILNPTPGIWTITLYGDIVLDGNYDAWLPIRGFVTEGVEFLVPSPNNTVIVPSTSAGNITVAAYNDSSNSLYIDSSWGPTSVPSIGIDLAAPGVNVLGTYPKNNGTMTGTGVAAAITTGATALMLEWGIVNGNDVTLNTYRIRAFLIRGCIRDPNIEYPNYEWGYGKLNLLNTFNQLL